MRLVDVPTPEQVYTEICNDFGNIVMNTLTAVVEDIRIHYKVRQGGLIGTVHSLCDPVATDVAREVCDRLAHAGWHVLLEERVTCSASPGGGGSRTGTLFKVSPPMEWIGKHPRGSGWEEYVQK